MSSAVLYPEATKGEIQFSEYFKDGMYLIRALVNKSYNRKMYQLL